MSTKIVTVEDSDLLQKILIEKLIVSLDCFDVSPLLLYQTLQAHPTICPSLAWSQYCESLLEQQREAEGGSKILQVEELQ